MSATLSPRLQTLVHIAQAAGEVVMRHYQAGCDTRIKADRSPVTDADEEAEKLILAELAAAFPSVPVVAEEEAAAGRVAKVGTHFFLVDPVDGTKEFVKRGGEFTVNIGEVVDGLPVSGVVLAPAIGRLFVGAAGEGAFELSNGMLRSIMARAPASDGLVAVSSRSHPDAKTDELLKSLTIKGQTNAGSSLKFCLVAAGEADIYPRAGQTMEWDTAAGHAVLRAAGGTMTTWEGAPFLYGKPGFFNGPFIARGKTD
jgi:3'(2'), 5'-bisphosphate nucleotidase